TLEPTATLTPVPEITGEPTLELPATLTPAPEITDEPTLEPTATLTPAPEITDEPTLEPTATLTPAPEITDEPTLEPTATLTPVPEITDEPTLELPATLTPVPEITDEPTLEPTATLTPVPEITPEVTEAPDLIGQLYTVSGQILGLPENSTYTLTLRNIIDTRTDTLSDVDYQYRVTAGHYRLTVVAAFHLPITLAFDVSDADVLLPPLQLTNGDFDGDGVITEQDARLLIHYYGHLIETAPVQMDLNGDDVIDLLDLVILTSHFRVNTSASP
ncbi:MAG: dockerin type I domain-containing protein, partial [Anaerolineae bacterium]